MKQIILLLILSTIITACGPSEAEIAAREKVKADSIATAAKEELLRQQAEAERQAQLKQQLIELKSTLAGEESRLESIQGFKFLRTQSEKAQQVAEQTRVIEELKAQIEEVKSQIKE